MRPVRPSNASGVSTFVVPVSRIARYASITQGVGVDRVPALVVLRPKKLDQAVPTASVTYGFQDGDSIEPATRARPSNITREHGRPGLPQPPAAGSRFR